MKQSNVVQWIAGVLCLVSVLALALSIHGGFSPGIDRKPHEALGRTLAKEAMSLLKPGGRLIVISRDTTDFKNPATDILVASFSKAVNSRGAHVDSIHGLQVDPLRPMEVPAGDFAELIHASASGSVIVSFMGPPVLSTAQRRQLGEIKPAIVAFCPGSWPDRVDLRSLFENGLLQAAVVSRRNPPFNESGQRSLQECFDQHFILITTANVSDLAVASETHSATNVP